MTILDLLGVSSLDISQGLSLLESMSSFVNGTQVNVVVPSAELTSKYDDETIEKLCKDEVKRLSKQLAPCKRPINIMVVDQPLPRTATRKIQRNKVKEMVLK